MKREEERVSDLSLEQYRLGELPPAAAAAMAERLDRDPSLAARLEHLAASDAEILAAHPAADVAAAIRGRLLAVEREAARGEERPARRLRPVRFASLALPAAAAVLLTLSLLLVRGRFLDADGVRLKGAGTALSAWRKVGEGAERLAAGAVARAGDVVQLSYIAAGARYGVILSIDGRGVVTFHLPEGFERGAARSPALDAGGEITLASAYELDDAPSFERFFLVYGEAPFEVAAVAEAARRLATRPAQAQRQMLDLPRGLRQAAFLLVKKG
jgi:anti-sigma factor RsiW